jgi:Superinfection immunity protein
MLHLIFVFLLYFLPSLMARDKKDFLGIFLVNFFLGWTLIGWVLALLWACAADRPTQLQYAPAGGGRFCSRCGTPWVYVVRYCSSCGARV